MANFHVGQLVCCVYSFRRERPYWPEIEFPRRGQIYTVREILINPAQLTLLVLEELSWPGFWCKRFRSVRSSSIESLRDLLSPLKIDA